MIEIPESASFAVQANDLLHGKVVAEVRPPSSPHKFAWFNLSPEEYTPMLMGRQVEKTNGYGAWFDIVFDKDIHLAMTDGANVRYYESADKAPAKYQFMLVFDDYSALVVTVAMYGSIVIFEGTYDNPYYLGTISKPGPLGNDFDRKYFDDLIAGLSKDMSVKAFLATEQRIPGLGNGVLQDILFNARINPKRKLSTLTEAEKDTLYDSVKETLAEMTSGGGRDTEKNLTGEPGGYRSILSKNTYHEPCPVCNAEIVKEAYMGGAVYYCPVCQPIKKK